MICSLRGHTGNQRHRGACVQKVLVRAFYCSSSPLTCHHPLSQCILPNILGSSFSFLTDLSQLLCSHLTCNHNSLFQLGLQDWDLKASLLGQTAILQSQAARKWLGEERKPWTWHFFQEKKQLKTLVFLQAHIPALHLESKRCSTKNLKRGNETTALSAPRFRKCWQLGMDNHKKTIWLLVVQQWNQEQDVCQANRSPLSSSRYPKAEGGQESSPLLLGTVICLSKTQQAASVRIHLSHTALLHVELLFLINHTCVHCYGMRIVWMLIRQPSGSLPQVALLKKEKEKEKSRNPSSNISPNSQVDQDLTLLELHCVHRENVWALLLGLVSLLLHFAYRKYSLLHFKM